MATVAIIDSHAHPAAAGYYNSFSEPLADGTSVKVGRIVRLPRMRLDQLLETLSGLDVGSTAIVVSHGANGGMVIPMSEHTKTRGFGPDAVALLMRCVEGHVAEDEAAKQLQMPLSELTLLKKWALATRKAKLARIVFRACNLGGATTDLDRLREFFGATKACAPDLFDSYVTANTNTPTTDARTWRNWLAQRRGEVVFGRPPERFAYHRVRHAHSFQFDTIAESDAAVQNWIRQHLGTTATSIGTRFPVHALQNGGLIFPAQKEYRDHLHEVPEARAF
jgi:hypothetical protein